MVRCLGASARASTLLAALLFAACSEAATPTDAGLADARSTDEDAGSGADADAIFADAAAPDAEAVDAGAVDAGGLAATCIGDCQTVTLMAAFGASRGGFERAFYGITAASASSSGVAELHVEAMQGGAAGCPTESSPTPDWTLILDGLPLPLDGAPLELGAPLAVSFLDFAGRFLHGASPLTRATAATLTPVAADVCEACVGGAAPSDPDGFVALEVRTTFTEGAIVGHLYATHCDSFDVR